MEGCHGIQLPKTYRKIFIVGPLDTVSPTPETWSISSPSAKSKDRLRIQFGEPLDAVLAQESFLVTDSSGRVLPGNSVLLDKENELNFVPFTSWNTGTYHIVIDSILEDLAGNNLNRLFDTDIQNRTKSARYTIYLSREFKVR